MKIHIQIICSFSGGMAFDRKRPSWSQWNGNRTAVVSYFPPRGEWENELIIIFGACKRWKSDVNRNRCPTRPDFMFFECKFREEVPSPLRLSDRPAFATPHPPSLDEAIRMRMNKQTKWPLNTYEPALHNLFTAEGVSLRKYEISSSACGLTDVFSFSSTTKPKHVPV